jgi:hypothetical protein
MNTVREAAVTKSGNPLRNKSRVELTLRVIPPATEVANSCVLRLSKEVAV